MDDILGFSSTRAVGSKCGRWNPTAEQVKVLTDLFRSGLRTPSTDQIQMISAHLSAYGKIESKNVFYWFQNHKARERHGHKKRRRGSRDHDHVQHEDDDDSGGHHSHKVRTRSIAYCVKEVERDLTISVQERDEEDRELGDQTLELFPLKSYSYSLEAAEQRCCKGRATAAAFLDASRDHLPLDLRLSFW